MAAAPARLFLCTREVCLKSLKGERRSWIHAHFYWNESKLLKWRRGDETSPYFWDQILETTQGDYFISLTAFTQIWVSFLLTKEAQSFGKS